MLRRSSRISRGDHLSELIRKGTEQKSRFFICKWAENGLNRNRYAALVGKKLLKSAVMRNHYRRKIYTAARQLEQEGSVHFPAHSDIVLLCRHAALKLKPEEFKQAVHDILNPRS